MKKAILILVCNTIALLIAGEALSADSTWYKEDITNRSNWQYRRKLALINMASNEAFEDMPIEVHLDPSDFDFSLAQVNGQDIRFVMPDNKTEIPYVIEWWDEWVADGIKGAWLWVKVSLIEDTTNDNFIYMYYGNPQAGNAQSSFQSIFGNDYAGVFQGIPEGVTTRPGLSGGRINQFGNSGFSVYAKIRVWDYNYDSVIMRWGNPNDPSDYRFKLMCGDGNLIKPNRIRFAVKTEEDSNNVRSSLKEDLDDPNDEDKDEYGVWLSIFGVRDVEAQKLYLYINGELRDECDFDASSLSDSGELIINEGFLGEIDEVRVETEARSEDWVYAYSRAMSDQFAVILSQVQYSPRAKINIEGGHFLLHPEEFYLTIGSQSYIRADYVSIFDYWSIDNRLAIKISSPQEPLTGIEVTATGEYTITAHYKDIPVGEIDFEVTPIAKQECNVNETITFHGYVKAPHTVDNDIEKWVWNFGSGQTEEILIEERAPGDERPEAYDIYTEYSYSADGVYPVTLTAKFGDGKMFEDLGDGQRKTYILTVGETLEIKKEGYITVVKRAIEPPHAPSGLSLAEKTHEMIKLSWNDNSLNEDFFILYRTEVATGDIEYINVGASSGAIAVYEDSLNIKPGTNYRYKVQAGNAIGGNSSFSSELTVTAGLVPGQGETPVETGSIEIPTPDDGYSGILMYHDPSFDPSECAPERFGGPSASLAHAYKFIDGENQSEAIFIPFLYYNSFLARNSIDLSFLDEQKFYDDAIYRAQILSQLQAKLAPLEEDKNAVDQSTINAVKYALAQEFDVGFSNVKKKDNVRFGSSSNAEGLIGFSGGGLFDSASVFSNSTERDNPDEAIAEGLVIVWMSLWRSEAVEAMIVAGIDLKNVRMGVLIIRDHENDVRYLEIAAGSVETYALTYTGEDSAYKVVSQITEKDYIDPDKDPQIDYLVIANGAITGIEDLSASSEVASGQRVLSDTQLMDLGEVVLDIEDKYEVTSDIYTKDEIYLTVVFEFVPGSSYPEGKIIIEEVREMLKPGFELTSSCSEGGFIDPLGTRYVLEGLSQEYLITPNTGYGILDVIVDGVFVGAVTEYTFENVLENHTIDASFEVIAIGQSTSIEGGSGSLFLSALLSSTPLGGSAIAANQALATILTAAQEQQTEAPAEGPDADDGDEAEEGQGFDDEVGTVPLISLASIPDTTGDKLESGEPADSGDISGTTYTFASSLVGSDILSEQNVLGDSVWWDEDFSDDNIWLYRMELTLMNIASTSQASDIPILVELTAANFNFNLVQDHGEDIRFVDADNGTILSHEIDSWDKEAQRAFIWLKVDAKDEDSSENRIYMYYGNSKAPDAQDSVSTWNGYVSVYHFGEQSGNYGDSTGLNDSTSVQVSSRDNTGEGSIGYYPEFGGYDAGDVILIPDSESLDFGSGDFTICVRAKSTVTNADADLVRKGSTGNEGDIWFKLEWGDQGKDNRVHFEIHPGRIDENENARRTVEPDGEWHNICGVRDSEANMVYLYVDGTLLDSAPFDDISVSNSCSMSIGAKDTGDDDFFEGYIDEIRISNVARDGDWLAAEYGSLEGGNIAYQAQEQYVQKVITSINPSMSKIGTEISIIGLNFFDLKKPDCGVEFLSKSGGRRGISRAFAEIIEITDTEIRCIVPTSLPIGMCDVTVIKGDLRSNSVEFQIIPLNKIIATSDRGGHIDPRGDVYVYDGEDQLFKITANTGYGILDVIVDGDSVGAVTEYEFDMVMTNHTIHASFEPLAATTLDDGISLMSTVGIPDLEIIATATPGGDIEPNGVVYVIAQEDQRFEISPNTGYGILNVLVDGESVGAVSEYLFENVLENHTIHVGFEYHSIDESAVGTTAGDEPAVGPTGDVLLPIPVSSIEMSTYPEDLRYEVYPGDSIDIEVTTEVAGTAEVTSEAFLVGSTGDAINLRQTGATYTFVSSLDGPDLNEDGVLSEIDLELLGNYLIGEEELSDEQLKLADLDSDGEITDIDYELMTKYIDGILPITNIKIVYKFHWVPTYENTRDEAYVVAFYSEAYDATGRLLTTMEAHRSIKVVQPQETGYGLDFDVIPITNRNCIVNETISFHGYLNEPFDVDNGVVRWLWDFGFGQTKEVITEAGSLKEFQVWADHLYSDDNIYPVSLEAELLAGHILRIEKPDYITARQEAGEAPARPSNLRLIEATHNMIRLAWNDNSDDEEEFIIYRTHAETGVVEYLNVRASSGAQAQYNDDLNIRPETEYRYKVQVRNEVGGNSDFSHEITVFTPSADVVPVIKSSIEMSTYPEDQTYEVRPGESINIEVTVNAIGAADIGSLAGVINSDGYMDDLPEGATYRLVEHVDGPDIDGDGVISIPDLELLEDYLAGNTILTDEELTLADLNGDGAISAIDGELLENYINGVLDSLPANPIKIVYDFEWEPTVDQARDEDYVIAFYSETYDAEGNVLGTVETHRRIKMIQPEETGYGTEPPEPQIEFVFDSTQNPDGSVMIKFRAETLDDQSRYPSDDPRRIAQWEWDFGDESSYGKSQVVAIDHTYAKSGTYTVTLWATNYGGESADVERNVIVKVLLPDEILSVEIEPPFASGVIVGIGNLARFTFTADTKHAFNLPIQAYSWELKKINARWGETITTDSNSVRCEFGSGSSYILIVTVEDEYGNSATDSADISIYDQTGYGQGYWIWEN